MSPEQYWEGDSELVKFYRKADDIKKERENQRLWLEGAYFYEALVRISPVLHAFAKRGTRPKPYLDDPFPISSKGVDASKNKREAKEYEKNKAIMAAWAAGVNKRFAEKEVNENAGCEC